MLHVIGDPNRFVKGRTDASGWPNGVASGDSNASLLTLGQINSALAYYWDHQAELDEEMARDLASADELRSRTPVPPIVERLRALTQS